MFFCAITSRLCPINAPDAFGQGDVLEGLEGGYVSPVHAYRMLMNTRNTG
jgi:hypothetical protein